jgi:hypothetical protein
MEKEITRLDHKAYTGLSSVNQQKFLKNNKTLRDSRNQYDQQQQYLTTTYRTKPSEILVKNYNNSGGGPPPPFNLNETSYN